MARVRSTEALNERAATSTGGGDSNVARLDTGTVAADAVNEGEHTVNTSKTENTSPPPTTTAGSSTAPINASETRKAAAQDDAAEKDVMDADLPLDVDGDAPLNGGTVNDEDEFSLAGDDTPSSATPAPSVDDMEPILTATPSPAPLPVDDDGEPPVTPAAPVVIETTPPPVATLAVTAKPMLRTDSAVSNSATLHSRLNQGSPVLLLSFAVICCGFLLLWVRKRRAHDSTGSGDKSASATSSSKVQYSRIENKSESPFEDNDDDGDESDDGRWDDWEGGDMGRLSDEPHVATTAYQSSLYANPNPFAAAAASPPMSPDVVAQSAPPLSLRSPFTVAPRLSAPLSVDTYARELLVPDVAAPLAGSAHTGPSSNSSSDSYEVVTDDPALLHSSPFTSSKAASPPSALPFADEADKQQDEADDLFSVRRCRCAHVRRLRTRH